METVLLPVSLWTGHVAEQIILPVFVLCLFQCTTKPLDRLLLPKQNISNIYFCNFDTFFLNVCSIGKDEFGDISIDIDLEKNKFSKSD